MKETTREWLIKAKDDPDVIDAIKDREHLTSMTAFHAQQAVEKCLKAVIEENEIAFVKTHNLEKLFELISDHITIQPGMEIVKKLDKLYIDARYPASLGLLPYGRPSLTEAMIFIDFSMKIYNTVTSVLGQ